MAAPLPAAPETYRPPPAAAPAEGTPRRGLDFTAPPLFDIPPLRSDDAGDRRAAPAPEPTKPVTERTSSPSEAPKLASEPAKALPPAVPQAAPERLPTATPSLQRTPATNESRLLFEGESADLSPAAMAVLDAVIARLERQPDLRLQLKAYASGSGELASRARRLSFSRALAVRAYLLDRGVRGTRIDVRALGGDTEITPRDRVDLSLAQ